MEGLVELLNFFLYCVQQLGIVLGVGGEAVFLALYFVAIRDNNVDSTEAHFAKAVARIAAVGLFLIIISGIGITAIHIRLSEDGTIFEPAFVGKWLLILFLVFTAKAAARISAEKWIIQGVVGGTWLALFLLHVIAPVAPWGILIILYTVWMILFFACWSVAISISKISLGLQNNQSAVPAYAAPVPAAMPSIPVQQARVIPQPPMAVEFEKIQIQNHVLIPVTKIESLPTLDASSYQPSVIDRTEMLHPHTMSDEKSVALALQNNSFKDMIESSGATVHLPAVRIMPKTAGDLETQHKGPAIKFG